MDEFEVDDKIQKELNNLSLKIEINGTLGEKRLEVKLLYQGENMTGPTEIDSECISLEKLASALKRYR